MERCVLRWQPVAVWETSMYGWYGMLVFQMKAHTLGSCCFSLSLSALCLFLSYTFLVSNSPFVSMPYLFNRHPSILFCFIYLLFRTYTGAFISLLPFHPPFLPPRGQIWVALTFSPSNPGFYLFWSPCFLLPLTSTSYPLTTPPSVLSPQPVPFHPSSLPISFSFTAKRPSASSSKVFVFSLLLPRSAAFP